MLILRSRDALDYAEKIKPKLSSSTFRTHIGILKSAFEMCLPSGSANPFSKVNRKSKQAGGAKAEGTIHRKPFTADELFRLIDVARGDSFMHPLIVAAACTGMRRGDVCQLRWSDIDLEAGIVSVKTSKTAATVEIPLFNPLREVLESRANNGSEFVFPEAEQMYRENESGLTYRFKKLVALALAPEMIEPASPVTPPKEIEQAGNQAIQDRLPTGRRRDRMLETFRRYCAGESFKTIEKQTGVSRSTISADLHAVEGWIGKQFITQTKSKGNSLKSAIASTTRVKREQGMLSASIRDWHALRTTFVTLALSANIPIELVKCVTGHTTVEVVLRHYFKPGREAFKSAFTDALPDVLTGAKSLPSNTGSNPDNSITTEFDALFTKVKSGEATDAEKARFREMAAQI